MRSSALVIATLASLSTACASTSGRPAPAAFEVSPGALIVGLRQGADALRLPELLHPESLGVTCQAGDFAGETIRLVRCTGLDGAALTPEQLEHVRQGFAARPEVAFVELDGTATAR